LFRRHNLRRRLKYLDLNFITDFEKDNFAAFLVFLRAAVRWLGEYLELVVKRSNRFSADERLIIEFTKSGA
jgi:hypothetical protein